VVECRRLRIRKSVPTLGYSLREMLVNPEPPLRTSTRCSWDGKTLKPSDWSGNQDGKARPRGSMWNPVLLVTHMAPHSKCKTQGDGWVQVVDPTLALAPFPPQVLRTNQFSVTRHEKVANGLLGDQGLPGVFVLYELSPMMVKLTEKHR
jgi:hypothetical protein